MMATSNKTYHSDRIARLTVPSHHIKNFNVKILTFANANADTDAGGSTIALPGLRPGKLKSAPDMSKSLNHEM